MYDLRLDTLLLCANLESFSKAANELYLTPTAAIKQINALEADLGVTLFERTHRGLILTPAGKQLVIEAEALKKWSEKALRRVRAAQKQADSVLHIGITPLTPMSLLAGLWPSIQPQIPDLSFEMVSFENSLTSAVEILKNLRQGIDLVAGVFDDQMLVLRKCQGLEVKAAPFCIGGPYDHPLAKKSRLTLADLENEVTLTIQKGWSDVTDRMSEDLLSLVEGLRLDYFEVYSTENISRSVVENKLLIALEHWGSIHPLLRFIPIDWPYTISYGFLYGNNPSRPVQRFLDAVAGTLN